MNSTSIDLTALRDADADSHRAPMVDSEITPLDPCKVPLNEPIVRAPEVAERVGQIHAT
jgi:hypothetical protein